MTGELIRTGILNAQFCIPNNWTDEDVITFAKSKLDSCCPSIKREHSNGDDERVVCANDPDKVHIVVDY